MAFSGVPQFGSLVQSLQHPPAADNPLADTISLLSKLIGKQISVNHDGVAIPGTGPESSIVQKFLQISGVPVSAAPITAPQAGVPGGQCANGRCGSRGDGMSNPPGASTQPEGLANPFQYLVKPKR